MCVVQERDKLILPRCIVFELIQALKFKMTLPDENLILLVQVTPLMLCMTLLSSSGELY